MPPFADVTAFVAKHKAVAVAGAAGAVVLGLRKRSQNKTAGVAGTTTAGAATAQLAPTGVYDSTSSDLYNSIQPEIDALASGQSKISDALSAITIAGNGGSSGSNSTGPLGGTFVAGIGAANENTWLRAIQNQGEVPTNTIPLYRDPVVGSSVAGSIPYGTTITPTGAPVVLPLGGGNVVSLYPVKGGYVAGSDFAARPA